MWEHAEHYRLHTWTTFKEMVGGFALAFVVAFPLAWLMSAFGPLRAILQPVFVTIQCIPMFALAPLMVLWFGWSYLAIIVPTALMIFFPLAMTIYQGLRSTPGYLLDFFKTHQASSWQIFFKLQLPWALPPIFSGFRIAVAIAGIGAVAGEWAGAQEGLGLLMLESRRAADIEMMFGALVCLTGLSLTLYASAVFFERVVCRRGRRKMGFVGAPLLVAFGMLIGGCQGTDESAKPTILTLDWFPNPNHTAIYAGLEQGFFREQGIDLKILKVPDPSNNLPYLLSGQAHLCLTYMPHAIQALALGAPIIPVGILIQQPLNALIYRQGEGIEKPEDLQAKTVGYCIDGFHMGLLKTLFAHRHIVPGNWRNANFDLVALLAGKHVDVLYGAYWNIECEQLRDWGVETGCFPLSEFGVPRYYELIFLARVGAPQASSEFTDKFQTAMQQSIDYARMHPEAAFESYLNSNPDKSSMTRVWEQRAWFKTIPVLATDQLIDPFVWETFVNWLQQHQLLN